MAGLRNEDRQFLSRVILSVAHVRILALIVVFGTGAVATRAGLIAETALAQPASVTHAQDAFDFNMPRLPLGEALTRYGEITGRSVLYETDQATGKFSSPVDGRRSPDAAIAALLAGTGLEAHASAGHTITVAPIASRHDRDRPSAATAAHMRQRQWIYDGYLQNAVFQSLCTRPDLQADRRRIVLRFSVNAQRRLEGLRVRVAEQPELEPKLRKVLMTLAVDPPPPGVEQPVLMMIEPGAVARFGGCSR
ncbi:hypothetical protein GG851_26745 [Bordetella petrii]|nr:hypothetical protein [Bordetella petrii]